MRNPICIVVTAVAMSGFASVTVAQAPPVTQVTREIPFERPEAWAMKYFGSVTLLTAMGRPRGQEPWSVELALEAGWIPPLSEDERRVGFNGSKVEDLNKLTVAPRPHLLLSLPWQTTLDVTWIPPLELNGVEADIVAVGLERPVWQRERWSIGLRVAGQVGEISGAYTCSEEDASSPPGSPENPFGCEEPSSDTSSIDYFMAGVAGGHDLGDRFALHYGAYATRFELEFQVDALTFGSRDRTRLVTDGWTWTVATGGTFRLGPRTRLALEALYTPLEVRRSPSAESTQNDPLFNLRAMIGWSWR